MRRILLSVAIAVALALACGAGAHALARLVDPFASDIGTVLTTLVPQGNVPDAGALVEVIGDHGPPSWTIVGYQLALAGTLIGGIPASLLGIALAARHRHRGRSRWSESWPLVFLAGFIFQLGSLIVAAMLMWLLMDSLWSHGDTFSSDAWLWTVFLFADVACCAAALPAWRTLHLAVPPAPPISIR